MRVEDMRRDDETSIEIQLEGEHPVELSVARINYGSFCLNINWGSRVEEVLFSEGSTYSVTSDVIVVGYPMGVPTDPVARIKIAAPPHVQIRRRYPRKEPDTLTLEIEVPDDATEAEILEAAKKMGGALDGIHRAHGKGGIEVVSVEVDEHIQSEVPQ